MGAGGEEVQVGVFGGWTDVGVLGGGWTRESGGGRVRGGGIDELVYLVSVCVRVFSVGFGPGLDSMSPARSRRSASHAAGTHGWLIYQIYGINSKLYCLKSGNLSKKNWLQYKE